jgi:hypothetical protein
MTWFRFASLGQDVGPDELRCERAGCTAVFIKFGSRRFCTPECSSAHRGRSDTRGSSAERGYGPDHQRERLRQLAALEEAGGWPCPICLKMMYAGDYVDLDHRVSLALGGDGSDSRLTHRRCNRGPKAARTRVRLQKPRREVQHSRAW